MAVVQEWQQPQIATFHSYNSQVRSRIMGMYTASRSQPQAIQSRMLTFQASTPPGAAPGAEACPYAWLRPGSAPSLLACAHAAQCLGHAVTACPRVVTLYASTCMGAMHTHTYVRCSWTLIASSPPCIHACMFDSHLHVCGRVRLGGPHLDTPGCFLAGEAGLAGARSGDAAAPVVAAGSCGWDGRAERGACSGAPPRCAVVVGLRGEAPRLGCCARRRSGAAESSLDARMLA
jgi:hypothetical protein